MREINLEGFIEDAHIVLGGMTRQEVGMFEPVGEIFFWEHTECVDCPL